MVVVVILGQVVLPCVIARRGVTKQSPPRWLRRDERGAVLVQTLLILPILILAVFGGYTVWKVAYVKQALHSGTYQATRYLCLNPVERPARSNREDWEKEWAKVVVAIVACELENNGLAGDELKCGVADGADRLFATVDLDEDEDELECGLSFTVKTELHLDIGIPFLDRDKVTLWDQHVGRVEC